MPNSDSNSTYSSSNSYLRLGHLNVYHLLNKVPDLCVYLNQPTPFHVFGVTESRLKNIIDDSLISIPNYSVLRRDASFVQHTGIAVYIHDTIAQNFQRRPDLESDKIESLWIELKTPKSTPTLIGFIYRNPAATWDWYDDFSEMMDKASRSKGDIFLLGDFNIDLLNPKGTHAAWTTTTSLFGLKQVVKAPTRITSTSSTLIDHIYTTNTEKILNVSVPSFAVSDHNPVCCVVSTRLGKQKRRHHTKIIYRSFRNFEKDKFLNDLQMTPFHEVYNYTCPDAALSVWLQLFLGVLNKHAPLREKRVKHSTVPPWLTVDIKRAMSYRDKLKREKSFDQYKKQRNQVKYLVRAAKKAYFNKMMSEKRDTASIWKAINLITKGKTVAEIPSNFSADNFNNFFLTAAETLAKSAGAKVSSQFEVSDRLKMHCESNRPGRKFTIPYMTAADLSRYISNMPSKRSTGLDSIDTITLKMSLPYIVEYLVYIYNLCIEKNVFPSALKEAKVVPVPKSKQLNDINNYRPISLLPVLSKPLEKHIHKHLHDFLETNKLFHTQQSGFRPKHSCQTALTRIVDNWLLSINKNMMSGALFLDLKKAFDLVDHNILLEKLKCYHVSENVVSILRSYLQNRKQKVYVNGNFSSQGNIKYGVPQGSILGPLLFLLFINDLPLNVTSSDVNCDLFADDTSLHAAGKTTTDISNKLQTSLDKIEEWCKENHMILHPTKTKSMLLTTRQKHQLRPSPLRLEIQREPIEQVTTLKFLGICVDQQLSWETHINELCKTISKNIFLLSRLRHITDKHSCKLFFNAHIKSHIDYISTVWDGCGDVHIIRLNSLYKRAVKIIQPGPAPTTDKMKELDILSLRGQLNYNKCVLMHKTLHNNTPEYLKPITAQTKREGTTRNGILPLPLPRIDLYKTSFSFSGPTLWNSLPANIKTIDSLKCFKRKLHKHLRNQNM